jgi:integrase/recombinase XerD
MAQAKVLTEKEIRKVLLFIGSRKHNTRNRAMFVVLNATGMRVGELAALRLCDVLTSAGEVVDKSRDQGQGALHEQERDHRPDFR